VEAAASAVAYLFRCNPGVYRRRPLDTL